LVLLLPNNCPCICGSSFQRPALQGAM
jgi:hypothetical protein